MKHFNKFKSHLRSENTELPEGFDWDDMEDGILNKMGKESQNPNNSTSDNKIIFFRLAALVSTLLIFIMYMYIKNSELASPSQSIKDKIESIKPKAGSPEVFVSKNNSPNEIPNAESKIDLNLSKKSANDRSAIKSQSQSAKEDLSQVIATQNSTINKVNLEDKIEDIEVNVETSEMSLELDGKTSINLEEYTPNSEKYTHANSSNSKSESFQNSADEKPVDILRNNTPTSNANQINDRSQSTKNGNPNSNDNEEKNRHSDEMNRYITLPTIEAKLSHDKSKKHFIRNELDVNPIINPVNKRLWNIELSSGWNTWNYGLSNLENTSNIYQNTHSEYGFNYSTRIGREISNNISLTSGIDLDFLYKRLEVNYNNYKYREVENALLSYSLNSITGEKSNPVYGDTTVVDTIVKSLTDFNKFQVIQIPLMINYKIFSNHSWRLEAGVGPSISMLINYSGKYLENDVLHSYSKAENTYSTSPKIALNANIMISKSIGQNYYIGIRADFRKHYSSWSTQSEDAINPKIVSGLITLGKSF